MSDDPTPDDAFDQELGARLHAAADGIDGGGVTRVAVAATVERGRRRQARRRATAVGVAAAVTLLGGLAMAASSADDGGEHVRTANPTTTVAPCVPGQQVTAPAGWFRLTAEQAEALVDAAAITVVQGDQHATHAVLLSHADLLVLDDPPVGPIGDQVFQLGYEDSAGIGLLRSEGLLTPDQEVSIDAGIAPVLQQEQVDRVMDAFPDLLAVAAGGEPFPSSDGIEFSPPEGVTTTVAAADEGGCGEDERTEGPAAGEATETSTTADRRRPEGAPEPVQPQDALPGGQLWAVYVDAWAMGAPGQGSGITTTTSADGHTDFTEGEDRWWTADARAADVGYLSTLTELACDEGWDGAPDSPKVGSLDPGERAWAVAVYFGDEAAAREFAELLPGDEAGIAPIRRYCTG